MNKRRNILVIGAHPDDYEIGAGMAIASYKEQGDRIISVVCSNGNVNGESDKRKKEAEDAAEILGIDNIHFLKYQDTRFPEIGKIVGDLEKISRKVNPYLVITHSDIDSHQDHFSVAIASRSAFRNERQVLLYMGFSSLKEYCPSILSEGSKENLEKKIKAIFAHKSQICKINKENIVAHAIYFGTFISADKSVVRYAEPFITNHYTLGYRTFNDE